MIKYKIKAVSYICSILLLAFSLTAQAAPGGAPGSKTMVTVGKVTEATETFQRSLVGIVISPSVVNLTARVSAEIKEIGFKEGEYVKEGQILYTLDPVKYAATVKSDKAKIAEAKARYSYAKTSYERKKTLFSQKVNTKDDLDNAQSELDAYKAALEDAEAALITAEDDLKNTKITAPISGQIGITNFTKGNYITPSSGTLATIVQLDPVRVRFTISNRDFLSLFADEHELKQLAVVKLVLADGKEYKYDGKVEFINNMANQNTDTIQIFAQFKNPNKKLIPGSVVTVELIKNKNEKVTAILPSAVMYDNDGVYVYAVTKDKKIERRNVVLGSSTPELQLVDKGLQPGEEIVIDGMHKVMPGSEIIPDYSEN